MIRSQGPLAAPSAHSHNPLSEVTVCCLFRQRSAERKLSSSQSWPIYLKDEADGGKFSSSLLMQFGVAKEKDTHKWKILSALNLFSQTCVFNNGHFWTEIPAKCFTFSFLRQDLRMRKNLRQINVTNEVEPLCACRKYLHTHTHARASAIGSSVKSNLSKEKHSDVLWIWTL